MLSWPPLARTRTSVPSGSGPPSGRRPRPRRRAWMLSGRRLIESQDHARARGAEVLARVMGASITSDGYDEGVNGCPR